MSPFVYVNVYLKRIIKKLNGLEDYRKGGKKRKSEIWFYLVGKSFTSSDIFVIY